MSSRNTVGKDLGKGAFSFGVGYLLQLGANEWYRYATGQPAVIPSETVNDFVGYWSPVVSPWNFVGLVAGLGLSLVPEKAKSTGRELARLAGRAILGAEGWGYAGHTIAQGYTTPFLSPLSGAAYPRIPKDATVPPTSFYAGDGQPKNFF